MYTCKQNSGRGEQLEVVDPVSSQVSGPEQSHALTAWGKHMKRVSMLPLQHMIDIQTLLKLDTPGTD